MVNILIVDDDYQNRDILKTFLEQGGYHLTEATNGQEGIEMALAQKPDLVLLDVMMPKVDGWNVCRTLKKNPETKSIPIVILTARSQEIDEMRGFESGADEYLTKPYDFPRLTEVLHQFLTDGTPKE